jgi:hypothetical protein
MSHFIEDKLEASLRIDAINGEPFERDIVAQQILEAISELRQLRMIRNNLAAQIGEEVE